MTMILKKWVEKEDVNFQDEKPGELYFGGKQKHISMPEMQEAAQNPRLFESDDEKPLHPGSDTPE